MIVLGVLVAFGHGLVVGAAVALVFIVLGLVSQCAAVTGTRRFLPLYGKMVCLGAFVASALHLVGFSGRPETMPLLLLFGLFAGIYLGVVLSALAEVLNIFPMISGKLKLAKSIRVMAFALAAGKTLGVAAYYFTPWFQP
ncbi:MAG: stage V sporulation protein AB [Christensenellales bacterium]|jgi:stage V sporulation protein AB